MLEEAGAEYKDTREMPPDDTTLQESLGGGEDNPPYFAPPLFRHGDLIISQTPNIFLYLAPKLELAGSAEHGDDLYRVNALALTALDLLSNEVHDTHHPISTMLFWEDQKEESKRRSKEFIQNRLPRVLSYWQRVLESEDRGRGPWLLGNTFTYADLVLFQVGPFVVQIMDASCFTRSFTNNSFLKTDPRRYYIRFSKGDEAGQRKWQVRQGVQALGRCQGSTKYCRVPCQ